MSTHPTKKTIIDTCTIFFVKKVSNFFWDVADTWSYKSEKIAQRYNNSIEDEYQKECSVCHLSPNSQVLHVGCGAYPLTEIVLAHCCQGRLVGIDRNPVVVRRAQEIIARQHLQDRISIHLGDGINYPVDGFDMILVSSCSLPKVQILEHLFTHAKHQCIIVVRELRIALGDLLQCIEDHPEIEILQQMHHTPFPFYGPLGWDTLYLRKQ